MEKKISGLVFLLLLLAGLGALLYDGGAAAMRQALSSKEPFQQLENVVKDRFPLSETLRHLQVSLNYMSGLKEQNGVFISKDALMLDVQPKDQQTINENTQAMLRFSQAYDRASYVMLIPTACAVQQYKVPYNATAPLYNQKQQLIDDVYRQLSGHLTSIDVYPVLHNHQEEYLYYRTDSSPTGLGGYYIYTVAAQKLGLTPRGLGEFDVKHLDYEHYGDLYDLSPYREVEPDRISAYLFSKNWRGYAVTHSDKDGQRTYYSLYPEFRKELGDTKDILLGGDSPRIDIDISNPQYTKQLLIFGDDSFQSYLPFLLIHYEKVTFINTTKASAQQIEALDVSEYNQILFAYSVDHFVTEPVLSVLEGLLKEPTAS